MLVTMAIVLCLHAVEHGTQTCLSVVDTKSVARFDVLRVYKVRVYNKSKAAYKATVPDQAESRAALIVAYLIMILYRLPLDCLVPIYCRLPWQ